MGIIIGLLLLLSFCFSASTQTYLTPQDFGLHLLDHGRMDYTHPPTNVLCGHFNSDPFTDIARFSGNRLEIYIFLGKGYSPQPQGIKSYSQPI